MREQCERSARCFVRSDPDRADGQTSFNRKLFTALHFSDNFRPGVNSTDESSLTHCNRPGAVRRCSRCRRQMSSGTPCDKRSFCSQCGKRSFCSQCGKRSFCSANNWFDSSPQWAFAVLWGTENGLSNFSNGLSKYNRTSLHNRL